METYFYVRIDKQILSMKTKRMNKKRKKKEQSSCCKILEGAAAIATL
jgi:hypothetical protein